MDRVGSEGSGSRPDTGNSGFILKDDFTRFLEARDPARTPASAQQRPSHDSVPGEALVYSASAVSERFERVGIKVDFAGGDLFVVAPWKQRSQTPRPSSVRRQAGRKTRQVRGGRRKRSQSPVAGSRTGQGSSLAKSSKSAERSFVEKAGARVAGENRE